MMRRMQLWSTVALSVAILSACSDDEDTTTTDTTAAETSTPETTAAETTVAETTTADSAASDAPPEDTAVATAQDTTPLAETHEADTATAEETTAGETSVGVTFDDPHAVFAEKCTPCHAGGSSGGHNMAATSVDTAYTDSQKGAANPACNGKTKGACALVRIQAGQMPLGRGCSGNPDTDAANASCLTAAQQATLKAWIDGGQLAPR